jgi:hypothetical protein
MGRRMFALVWAFVLQGCVTQGAVRDAPGDAGLQGTYRAPPDKLRGVTLEALSEAGFALRESSSQDRGRWLFLALQEPPSGTGHFARILVEPHEGDTAVWIYVRSRTGSRANDAADAALAHSIHDILARKLGEPAPGKAGAPGTSVDVGIEKTFRSPFPVSFDAALKVCRERDFQIRESTRTGDTGRIAAHGRGMTLSLSLARTPAEQTRVILHAEGRALPENREEAKAFLDKLREELLEPRD